MASGPGCRLSCDLARFVASHISTSEVTPLSYRVLAGALLVSSLALAQAPNAQTADLAALQAAVKASQSAGDNAWMLISSALVLMMTGPGLALFYGGLVRKKNVLGTMMQSFAMMAAITLLWFLCGYSLVFAEGNPVIGDLRYAFLRGVGGDPNLTYAPTIPHQTFMIYQLMFAIITPALIAGAFAERMRFSAMLVFSTFLRVTGTRSLWNTPGSPW